MKSNNRTLAMLIADSLFENGDREYAKRLVLTSHKGKDLGGWCKESAITRIEEKLNQWNPPVEVKGEK